VRREAEEAAGALEGARERMAVAAEELETARQAAREAREAEAGARAELFRADEAHTSLQGKFNALEALERERVGLAPAAARLLRERGQFPEGTVVGPVSDFITASSDSAVLVERFLGATVHAILVRDREAADAVRRWHTAANPGPLLLLPIDAMPDDDALVEDDALAGLVDAAQPARAWVRALLGHARAVDNGAAFVDARGAVFLPGTAAGPGPLRRRAELAELKDELAASARAREVAATAAEMAREVMTVADTRATHAGDAANEAAQLARRADEHRGEVERRRQRAERELGEAEALAGRLRQRQESLAERVAELDRRAGELAETLAEGEGELSALRGRLTESERMLDEAREARTMGQVQQAQAQARLQVATDSERRLSQERESAASRLESLHAELSTLSQADSVLAEQMAGWQMDLETRQATLEDAEGRLSDAEEAVRAAGIALEAAEMTLTETRRRATSLTEELHHAEVRYTELSGRRTAIRERLEAEWRKPLEDLLATLEEVEAESDELRAEAEELRRQIDALGPVNPLAIEEHEEELKRLDFLTTQRADLNAARASLTQAIKEIDTTARELFLTTFAQVRENFRQIFMTLFGGGECDLRLENPEDPLNCDIEIHASPRGKRTQRIHLLSSGERALVALSLLFGIFLTKPSPFCLLDEVDAPLDDQNIGRFVRMLNQFKTRTQFIVITHNPRTTTEAADAVYGVTMQEPGVSSIVSVRMRGAAVEEAISGRAGNGAARPEPAGAGA
jgi:chromosome segregation protein